jgi:IS605 OrfB family transposase
MKDKPYKNILISTNMKKKKKDDKNEMRTISSYIHSNDAHKIFDYMTGITKNIFNHTIYCHKVFNLFRNEIFRNVYYDVFSNKLSSKNDIISAVNKKYNEYYKLYSDNLMDIKNVNYHSYQYIKSNYNNVLITNDNFNDILKECNFYISKKIKISSSFMVNQVNYTIKCILASFYYRSFFNVKKQIDNNKITCKDYIFIEHVKKDNILKLWKKKIEYIKLIKGLYLNEDKDYWKGFTYKNIVKSFVYSNLGDNKNAIPRDIVGNTINKTLETISSFFALKKKKIKANYPSYLDKNDKFIVPFFCRSFKKQEINGINYLRLTVGKFVAKNYNKLLNSNLICLNMDHTTDYKKYIDKKYLKKITKKMSKTKNFIVNDEFYIEKNNKNIIDSYYLFIQIPKRFANKKIKLVEIVPRYNDGHKFKYDISYEKYDKNIFKDYVKIKNDGYGSEVVGCDLGINNLMTFYDPTGESIIICGKKLVYTNKYYNNLIDKAKSENDKNKLRYLLIKRENKINDLMNKIVRFIAKKYSHKKEIVIGYNTGWKDKVGFGRRLNRKFYEIPYRKLLNKLKDLLEPLNIKLTIREESYTSKCDALSLEEVKKHDTYMGKRIKRGLYSSKQSLLVNADVNGAINILRKEYSWIKMFNKKLLNPVRINLSREVMRMKKSPLGSTVMGQLKRYTKNLYAFI